MHRVLKSLQVLVCLSLLSLTSATAQTNSYKQTNLVSDTQGMAPVIDSNLVNPWGICILPGDPFWISDNASAAGVTSLYTKGGAMMGSFVVAPPRGTSNPATPTGCVGNANGGFGLGGTSSMFIFDTEDGTISGWTGGASSILAVDNSTTPSAALGAVYKGLALLTTSQASMLLATNFRSGKVEVYDSSFRPITLSGNFTDPNPPAVPAGSNSPGYAAFGVHVFTINNAPMVLATFALQDTPMHDPLHIAGSGFVDLFDQNGNFVRRIADGSHLNAPWGAAIAPANFGAFAGNLLVGNFGDGTISAYDITKTDGFIDQMKDANGAVITNASLWELAFDPSGQTGNPNTMYVTAGLNNEMHGLFTSITANGAPQPPTADFSIAASPSTLTISAGQPASFTLTLGGLSGFTSSVSLSCSGQPLGSTCSFSPASVSPASGGTVTSTMTIATSSNPYNPAGVKGTGMSAGMSGMLLAIPALGFLGLLVVQAGRNSRRVKTQWIPCLAGSLALLIATVCVLTASGCGYNNPNGTGNGTQRGTTTVMVTGTSGNLTHSTNVTLTVQ
jgi:uncharacterized protein (TIGR03118 family)